MTETANGRKIIASTPERELEVVTIINTFEILEAATDKAAHDPSANFTACYQAQWTYYNNNYAILSKIGDTF